MSGMLVKVFSKMTQAIFSRFSALEANSTATPPPRERPNTTTLAGSTSAETLLPSTLPNALAEDEPERKSRAVWASK